jgi:hypothetical protein
MCIVRMNVSLTTEEAALDAGPGYLIPADVLGAEYLSVKHPWACSLCNARCVTFDGLIAHARGPYHFNRMNEAGALSGGERAPTPRVLASTWTCTLCNKTCKSAKHLASHMRGKRHKKKQAKAARKAEKTQGPGGTTEVCRWTCTLCNVECSADRVQTHEAGRKHKAKQAKAASITARASDGVADSVSPWTCTLCNVNCNSAKSHHNHLLSKRHAKKQRLAAAVNPIAAVAPGAALEQPAANGPPVPLPPFLPPVGTVSRPPGQRAKRSATPLPAPPAKRRTMPPAEHITTATQMQAARAILAQEREIAVAFSGAEDGSTLEVIQLCGQGRSFAVDLHCMTPSQRVATLPHLAQLLQAGGPLKVAHDSRRGVQALFNLYSIRVAPVWDCQVAYGVVQLMRGLAGGGFGAYEPHGPCSLEALLLVSGCVPDGRCDGLRLREKAFCIRKLNIALCGMLCRIRAHPM